MTSPAISFDKIRILGSQNNAFEELCIQLATAIVDEPITGLERIRGAGGDGGVEAIITTASGIKVGIQSKFFLGSLQKPQWSQIDRSVNSAANNYKDLKRYIVCCATNRTPTGVEKWKRLLSIWKGMYPNLTVEWKGATELTGLLTLPQSAHLATYWFDAPAFDWAWTKDRSEEAIKQLHKRYTPQLHRKTIAETDLGLLCGLKNEVETYRDKCSLIVKNLRRLQNSSEIENIPKDLPRDQANDINKCLDIVMSMTSRLIDYLHEGDLFRQEAIFLQKEFDDVEEALEAANNAIRNVAPIDNDRQRRGTGHREIISLLHKLTDSITDVKRQFARYQEGDSKLIFVTGEAGSGKSHLLATLVTDLLEEKRACLFLLGERFGRENDLRDQICSLVGWNHSFLELCQCMEAYAEIAGRPSVFVVDAINESPSRERWKSDLIPLFFAITQFPNIRVVMSCRSDWVNACLPDGLSDRLATVNHRGFDMGFTEAVSAYFKGYHVTSPHYPPLLPEFRNPLFLKTVCEAYEGQVLPSEPLEFVGVIGKWEDRLAKKIEAAIDCSSWKVKETIDDIVREMASSGVQSLPESRANAICEKRFREDHLSHSLYRYLCSDGLLQEVNLPSGTVVRLQYQRFSDIRIAQMELEKISNKREWFCYWSKRVLPSIIDNQFLKPEAATRLAAYALILPESIGLELVECPVSPTISAQNLRDDIKALIWDSWLRALPWRRRTRNSSKIVHYFIKYIDGRINPQTMWEQLLPLSCIDGHPLNAKFVHSRLFQMELYQREALLTIPLATIDIYPEANSFLGNFLEWSAGAAVNESTEEQAYLCALILIWMTSSTNTALRDRATELAIATLERRPNPLIRVLDELKSANDPYVIERLLAVAAGVVPSLPPPAIKKVAKLIMGWFFEHGKVPAHILQREYARFIVEFATAANVISRSSLATVKSPFGLEMPTLWSEKKVKKYEEDKGYGSITRSLRPEEMRMYGDFGRYEMGSAVHHFADPATFNPKAQKTYERFHRHDARDARRYIWQRVIELGWTPERYATYEKALHPFSRERPKIERIGKKYQWIGLHEYVGYLSDTHILLNWRSTQEQFQGAWQIYLRDFDIGAVPWGIPQPPGEQLPRLRVRFPSPLPKANNTDERKAWVQAPFASLEPYLTTTIADAPWLVLHISRSFNEKPAFGLERYKTDLMMQRIDVVAFLLPNKIALQGIQSLQKTSLPSRFIDVPESFQIWVSEYPWHQKLSELDDDCKNNKIRVGKAGDLSCFSLACRIGNETKSFYVPPPSLHKMMSSALGASLSPPHPNGHHNYQIADANGNAVFIGSCGSEQQLFVQKEALSTLLAKYNLTLIWCVVSEKSAFNGTKHIGGLSTQSAVYWLEGTKHVGGRLTICDSSPPDDENLG